MLDVITDLVVMFYQIGICAFGGGLAALSLMQYHLVPAFITQAQFDQIVAVSQLTPGPIAINAATYVGSLRAGILGAAAATLSLSSAPVTGLIITCAALKKMTQEQSAVFKKTLKPVAAGLLTLALIPPLRATYQNGYGAAALYVLTLIAMVKFPVIKKNTFLLMFTVGLLGSLITLAMK